MDFRRGGEIASDAAGVRRHDGPAGQAGQHILEVVEGFVATEFGRLHQAHDGGSSLASAQTAGKQPVLAAKCDGPDAVLDPVVVDRHLVIGEVMRERHPTFQAVVDGLGGGRAMRHSLPLLRQPGVQVINKAAVSRHFLKFVRKIQFAGNQC